MLQWKGRLYFLVGTLALFAGALGWLDGSWFRQLGW